MALQGWRFHHFWQEYGKLSWIIDPVYFEQALEEKGVSQDSAESGLVAVFGDADRQITFPDADSDDGMEEAGTENAGVTL